MEKSVMATQNGIDIVHRDQHTITMVMPTYYAEVVMAALSRLETTSGAYNVVERIIDDAVECLDKVGVTLYPDTFTGSYKTGE